MLSYKHGYHAGNQADVLKHICLIQAYKSLKRHHNSISYMATGKIKWFNPTKGYGFIENDAGGKDVFLHISALEEAGIDQLQEGEAVSFEIGENRGKENATNVKKVS